MIAWRRKHAVVGSRESAAVRTERDEDIGRLHRMLHDRCGGGGSRVSADGVGPVRPVRRDSHAKLGALHTSELHPLPAKASIESDRHDADNDKRKNADDDTHDAGRVGRRRVRIYRLGGGGGEG